MNIPTREATNKKKKNYMKLSESMGKSLVSVNYLNSIAYSQCVVTKR